MFSLPFLRRSIICVFCWVASVSLAQEYPNRPIRLLAGSTPGGGTDITARIVGNKLAERFGQTVIIDNRPGIGNVIARNIAEQSSPDGYTLVIVSGSSVIGARFVYNNPIDTRKTFASISLLSSYPFPLMINPSLPPTTVKELIAFARSKPAGSFNYGSTGVGSMAHLAAALFGEMAGIAMQHVPYKAVNIGMLDLMSARIQLLFGSATAAMPHAKSGKLRILAFSSGKRSQIYPDIPTIAESGLPGFDVTGWFSIMGPYGIPRQVVMKLNREIGTVLKYPDVVKSLAAGGADAAHSSPEQLSALIEQEERKWGKLAQSTGLEFK